MKLYYVVNARIPSDKAYGIQVACMHEAFKTLVEAKLVTPAQLRVPDWYASGRVGFFASSVIFMITSGAYLLYKRLIGEQFFVFTPDMDSFSGTLLPFIAPTIAEMHSPQKPTFLARLFFARVRGVVATTKQTKEALITSFGIPEQNILVEPNGADEALLQKEISKQEARKKLGLPDEPFALYVGRFYAWKGLGILAEVAGSSSLPIRLVGGTREEYEHVTGKSGEALLFAGARPQAEVPLWLSAADVLLMLGTAKNDDSYRYTSPMKIFEYLGARRAVVASKTPAVAGIIPQGVAFWYEPDNAAALAQTILQAHQADVSKKIEAGRALAAEHTWQKRARRIVAFMTATGSFT